MTVKINPDDLEKIYSLICDNGMIKKIDAYTAFTGIGSHVYVDDLLFYLKLHRGIYIKKGRGVYKDISTFYKLTGRRI